VADGGDEVRAHPDPLLFLFAIQQLGNPSCRLLFQAQVRMQNVEYGFFRYHMGGSNCLHRQVAIFINGGCDRRDEIWSFNFFFQFEMAYVSNVFASLYLLDDGVNGCF
jgi:hypothetical protein